METLTHFGWLGKAFSLALGSGGDQIRDVEATLLRELGEVELEGYEVEALWSTLKQQQSFLRKSTKRRNVGFLVVLPTLKVRWILRLTVSFGARTIAMCPSEDCGAQHGRFRAPIA